MPSIWFNTGTRQVSAPPGWDTWVPFQIFLTEDGEFTVGGLDMQFRAGITVAKTYYVDSVGGNDGDTGADWGHALKTLNVAAAKPDVDRIYIADGSYFYLSECNTEPTRNVEIIGVGTVTLSSNVWNETGAWTNVSNYYWATVGSSRYVYAVYDFSNLDAFGLPIPLTARANVGEVDANPNSFYFNYTPPNSTLYVRTFDDRAPDTDIHPRESGPFERTADNQTLYMENITIEGGFTYRNNTAAGGMRLYLKDCTFGPTSIHGVDEAILQNCTIRRGDGIAGDGINIDVRNGVITTIYEIGNTIYACGSGGTDQATTAHNACIVVRVNGLYYDVSGQVVADVGASEIWMLGCELDNSTVAGIGFYCGGTAWLDRCYIHDQANFGIQIEAGATVYHRNLTFAANGANVDPATGTYEEY